MFLVFFVFLGVARRLELSPCNTADTTYLCEAWQLLLERHEPFRDIEVSDMYQKLSVATQRGRNMGEHVNECMTYRNRLKALGADILREFFIQKLLDVDNVMTKCQGTHACVAAVH